MVPATVSPAEVTAFAAGAGLMFLVLVLWRWRIRRLVVRRLSSVSARLESEPGEVLGKGGIEAALARLERAADHAAFAETDRVIAVERLVEALEVLDLGVVVADEAGTVVHRNRAAAELGDGLAAEALAEAVAGRAADRVAELVAPVRRTIAVTAVPLSEGTREIGAVAVLEDVTGRRRLESARRDFVANLVREVQAPVGTVGLLAETLAGEPDPAIARRFAGRIHAEATRLTRVVADLVELSRVEAEAAPEREPHPVHLVVAEALERVRPVAAERQVAVEVGEAPRRLSVIGDRRQLVLALQHLLDNAVRHSPEGGVVQVGAWTDGQWVDLAVRDRGVGIPTPELDRIFERFYRVDRGAGVGDGPGLGLAIVRHVAAAHRGEVRVTSQEGTGSTFTLRLPAGPGPVAVSESESEAS